MSYVKSIEYGDFIEIYEYKYPPIPHKRGVRNSEKENPTEDEKYEKRKDNVIQTKKNFQRMVSANLGGTKPLFISFTFAENITDISVGYAKFKKFIQDMRYKFGKSFKYIAVPEFQKKGRVHFHALFWGLPPEINAKSERKERTLANVWDNGFVDVVDTDGHEKIAGYISKYMAKAFIDKNLKNQKAYTASRNIQRPITERNTLVNYALWGKVGAEDKPINDRKYQTGWLGECRFRLFKITKNE